MTVAMTSHALSKRPIARIFISAAGAAACCALLAGSSPAAAGFFDFLFQPPQPQPAPMQVYRRAAAPRHVHYTVPRRRMVATERRPKKIVVAARTEKLAEHKTRPVSTHLVTGLMDDDSLKNGDAVMTQEGLRIFVGSTGPHHDADDFARPSEIDSLSRRQRSALLAIDPARERKAEPELVVGRSAADPALSSGAMIVDARGNRIRYVGP